jgi:hypothetical protein
MIDLKEMFFFQSSILYNAGVVQLRLGIWDKSVWSVEPQ